MIEQICLVVLLIGLLGLANFLISTFIFNRMLRNFKNNLRKQRSNDIDGSHSSNNLVVQPAVKTIVEGYSSYG